MTRRMVASLALVVGLLCSGVALLAGSGRHASGPVIIGPEGRTATLESAGDSNQTPPLSPMVLKDGRLQLNLSTDVSVRPDHVI